MRAVVTNVIQKRKVNLGLSKDEVGVFANE